MKYDLILSGRFKKSLKLAKKRGLDISLLDPVVEAHRHRNACRFISKIGSRKRTLVKISVLFLCERICAAFSVVTVQSGDCVCPEMVTEAPKLLFYLPGHGLDLKKAGICAYDRYLSQPWTGLHHFSHPFYEIT